MSRKLDSLKQKFLVSPTLTVFVEYLEEMKKEKMWEEMMSVLDNWSGSETPEVNFYRGLALINSDRNEEGVIELRKVVQKNPNHFAAKRELEKLGADKDEPEKNLGPGVDLSKILVVERSEEPGYTYKDPIFRNIFIVLTLIIGLSFAVYILFIKEDKTAIYETLLENPQKSFVSLSYPDYVQRVKKYKIIDIKDEVGQPVKKSILYLTAYAMLDYNLTGETSEISQLKMYSTLVTEKNDELQNLIDYIEGVAAPQGVQLYHKLESDFPASEKQIGRLKISIPEKVTESNLRESFYLGLMFFRKDDLRAAEAIVDKILEVSPEYELAMKLKIMTKAAKSIQNNLILKNISRDQVILDRWRNLSIERYYAGEAKILLGRASNRFDIERDGFYSVCPGRYFCKDIVQSFIKRGDTAEASRMALYMKEQKENNRDSEDVKLVMETSFLEGDYSNCYFSFRELQQFFPDQITEDIFQRGAQCSEKNGYFEEAVAAYEKINAKEPDPVITAKILRMKYRLSQEELYFTQLEKLAAKNPDNKMIQYSFLDALNKKEDLKKTIPVLEKIFQLESDDNKIGIIKQYLQNGAVYQAVNHLHELKDRKEYRRLLNMIYNRYMLFDEADEVLANGELNDPLWMFFRKQVELDKKGEHQLVVKNIDKRMQTLDKCEPALLYLLAESHRNMGDKQRTFGMIDSILECNPFYLPGLVFAAEITYYQGDLTKATEGIKYILENEKFLSPGQIYYHNYLVLLNAEIMVNIGKENQIMGYLRKNLKKEFAFTEKDQEKVRDILEKLKLSKAEILDRYLKKKFKFKKPETKN